MVLGIEIVIEEVSLQNSDYNELIKFYRYLFKIIIIFGKTYICLN